jgi:hypothetical protein
MNDLSKAKTLLSLLAEAPQAPEQRFLIRAIHHRQWCPQAEQALLDICKSTNKEPDVRLISAEALLEHCDLNTYMPIAIEVVAAHDRGLGRVYAFDSVSNLGYRVFTLNERNKRMLLATGFKALSDLPENEMRYGVTAAMRLGWILKIKNEFAPGPAQKAENYHGGRQQFSTDTVKNALKWYSKHERETRDN